MRVSPGLFILRYRLVMLLILIGVTVFMAFQARTVKLSYKFAGLLPETDSTFVAYQRFVEQFSEDGTILVIGIEDKKLYTVENFRAWWELGHDLKTITVSVDSTKGKTVTQHNISVVDSVFSVAHSYNLVADTALKRFQLQPICSTPPTTRYEVDSIKRLIHSLPFYDGFLYNSKTGASLMMAFVNADLFNSDNRGPSVELIMERAEEFSRQTGIKTYISGLPFIRTTMMTKVKGELRMFIILAAGVCALLLFLFFRHFGVVLVCLGVVGVGVIWSLGSMALFGYSITVLMGLIPPLMIVIGVPNCIYLLNKYHSEYKRHGNKMMALERVVRKVGNATLLTNATTSLGFATFILTHSEMLVQFGVIASLNIMAIFLVSIITIPVVFSYLPAPKTRHTRHLDRKWLFVAVNQLVKIVQFHRRKAYVGAVTALVLGLYGISTIKTTGNIVDDLPDSDRVITDLRFFEQNFNGIMPFEILVDAQKKGAITKPAMLRKIEELQILLEEYPEISKSVSIAEVSKFAKQAFYNGDSSRYSLINSNERSFMGPYFQNNYTTGGIEKTFLDSSRSMTRISAQVADIGTLEMKRLLADLQPRVDSIFDPESFRVTMTGTSIVFLEGTGYLVKNLLISLILAIIVIAVIMAFLFRSFRMVAISLLPNLLPLIVTGGVMGFAGIPIKPSTILVFSIAFGISVDDTIHFLAKYRQELRVLQWNIKDSVLLAVKETGVSMMYTSIVLFFGFIMFSASQFEGTRALGILVAMTLLVAMFANLVILPSLLLSFEKSITTKAFSEPFLEIIDEEEDIALEELQVKRVTASEEDSV
jgi:uncharacterized protein